MKPLETLLVKGVAARRYPKNKTCSHPECAEAATDFHHIFPRSLIGNDSWFVIFGDALTQTSEEKGGGYRQAIPHVTGLCRAHHEAVELHRAWIRLKCESADIQDGRFEWYDRDGHGHDLTPSDWTFVGPLDPQPGHTTKARKTKPKSTEPARKSQTWSIRCPNDAAEDGIEALKTLTDEAAKALAPSMGWSDSPPPYFVLCAVLAYFIQTYQKNPAVGW